MLFIDDLRERIWNSKYGKPILLGTAIIGAFGGALLITGTASYIAYERLTGPSKLSTIETITQEGLPNLQLHVMPHARRDIPYVESTPGSKRYIRISEYLESIDKEDRNQVKSSILDAIKRHRKKI